MTLHPGRPASVQALAAGLLLSFAAPACAGDLARLVDGLAAPFKALHRSAPDTCHDDAIERLGKEIDWLQHQLDLHGSIVAKAPDVWGQNRLVRHRLEYEEQLRRQLPLFEQYSQAAIRRSDQSFLGMALAVQSAAGRRRGPEFVAVPEASVVNSIQTLLPTTNEAAGRDDPVVIARTAPFAVPELAPGMRFEEKPLALEPTLQLDHLSRYVNHLHELRRINEGDDSADAPGYALNLVRIPVSITTGEKTRKGHGAEITITVDPELDAALLPSTVHDLVINDLVDLIAPALMHCVNDPECVAWADQILAPATHEAQRAGVMAAMRSLAERLPAITPSTAPSMKTRRSRLPIPVSQLAEVAGVRQIAVLVQAARRALSAHPAARPCIEYVDVRGYLAEELGAASDLLALDAHRDLWAQLPGWRLPDLVRGRRADDLARVRCHVLTALGTGREPLDAAAPELLPGPEAGICCEENPAAEPLCRTAAAVFAWGILVESALLEERLASDMREAGVAACGLPLVGPDPAPEARAAFADYVRRRWPVRVFALDPAIDEQTVEDAFARRRELQIATAAAFATGRLNAQALQRYTRRMETDMSVVALNRTAVGFAHGADTFGWRFHPRVQTPPTRGQLAALGETLCGPSSDADLMQRALEPGIRECVAIVVMPSFVPRLTFDVQTRWFSLAHPAATEPGMRHTLKLSRSLKAIEQSAAACGRCSHLYYDGQQAHLMRKVEQLAERMPQQTLQARIPHENTCGGFELFDAGVTDLAPELAGWYGAPGVDPAAGTTLFLIGKGFSVHDTRVIAGGRPARYRLLSREVIEVEIPPGVQTIGGVGQASACHAPSREFSASCRNSLGGPPPAGTNPALRAWDPTVGQASACHGLISPTSHVEPLPPPADSSSLPSSCACNEREFVDIHLATPYGVTSHLLVPVARRTGGADAAGCILAFVESNALRLSFTVSKATGTRTEAARVDEFFAADADRIEIRAPEVFVPPARGALQFELRDESSGATAALFSFEPLAFDARAGAYVIAGGDLRNFVGDTSRPATDKTLRGALKPYLDALLARGEIANDGDTLPFTLTATLVADGQRVPVAGVIPVTVVRRGKTTVEIGDGS
jgi:hypothetical protein